MEHRKNSYDFVRFCAALTVIIAHHFLISGGKIPVFFGEDLAGWGLNVFFCLSGFLIFISLDRSNDAAQFLAARVTRIVPTLCMALVGASVVTLIYFHNYEHLINHVKYIYRNAALLFRTISDLIPGIFEQNPHPEINTPIWSLAYEMYLYFLLFVVMLAKRTWRVPLVLAIVVVFNLLWLGFTVNDALIPLTPIYPFRIGRLGSYFFAGVVLGILWPQIKSRSVLYGYFGAATFIMLSCLSTPTTFLHCFLLALAVIGIGSSATMSWFSKGGDGSYGIYIFGWPIQQFSFLVFQDFATSLLAALLFSIATGYATWHLYEKRFIAARKTIATRLTILAPRARLKVTAN